MTALKHELPLLRAVSLLALLLILLLAAYLRLSNLADNPGWYSDEGTHLSIAANLSQGRVQYLALNQSTLLVARLPLFEYLLSAAVRIGGLSMATLRHVTAVLGILSVGLLYLVAAWLLPKMRFFALLAALLYAIYPQAVLLSRIGFSYNLLTPLVLLLLLGLVKYWQTSSLRWLLLASACAGLGLVSDLIIGAFLVVLVLVILARNWRHLPAALVLMLLPFVLYALASLLSAPDAFWFDLQFTLTRLGGRGLAEQINGLALNYTMLLSQDFWLLAALVGLFVFSAAPVLRGMVLLLILLPMLILGRTNALYDISAYYFIPFTPLVALGAACFVYRATIYVWGLLRDQLRRWIPSRSYQRLVAIMAGILSALLIFTPLRTSLMLTAANVNSHLPTAVDPILLNPDDVRQVAAYVNAQVGPGETVIASPGLAWTLNANAADFQMALAADGQATPHFPIDVPADRWSFDPRYQRARFVVVDNLWRNWAVLNIPPLIPLLSQVRDWPLVFESGAI